MRKYIWELVILFILFIIVDVYSTYHNLRIGYGEANIVVLVLYQKYGILSVLLIKIITFSYVFLFAFFTNNYYLTIGKRIVYFRIFWLIFFFISFILITIVCVSNIILFYFDFCILDHILF